MTFSDWILTWRHIMNCGNLCTGFTINPKIESLSAWEDSIFWKEKLCNSHKIVFTISKKSKNKKAYIHILLILRRLIENNCFWNFYREKITNKANKIFTDNQFIYDVLSHQALLIFTRIVGFLKNAFFHLNLAIS